MALIASEARTETHGSDEGRAAVLKHGRSRYRGLVLKPGDSAEALMNEIYTLTGVPVARQKVMCKRAWKGTLKRDDVIGAIKASKGETEVTLVLVGTAEVAPLRPVEATVFAEDQDPAVAAAAEAAAESAAMAAAEGMVVALQKKPGKDRDDGKTERYAYSRYVTGLPQRQIEELMRRRRCESGALLGECVMTCGFELGRSYVTTLACISDGTLVSGFDDGHIVLWRHGRRVQDVVHDRVAGGNSGVACIAPMPPSVHQFAFATGGNGSMKLWTAEGECVSTLMAPMNSTPLGLLVVGASIALRFGRLGSPPSSNSFRLPPANAEQRRRRAQAEAAQAAREDAIARAARSVVLVDLSGGDGSGVGVTTLDASAAPVSALASLRLDAADRETMVVGDEMGALGLWSRGAAAGWGRSGLLQLWQQDDESVCVVCMEPIVDSHLLAVSVEPGTAERICAGGVKIEISLARCVLLLDVARRSALVALDAHADTVRCLCGLPDGSLATGGGKRDATVRVWEPNQWCHAEAVTAASTTRPRALLQEAARTLPEPGFVFALTVLPDAVPVS